MFACASQYIAFDGTVHGGGDECEWDFDQMRNYLGEQVGLLTL